jgi:hypothetical protein
MMTTIKSEVDFGRVEFLLAFGKIRILNDLSQGVQNPPICTQLLQFRVIDVYILSHCRGLFEMDERKYLVQLHLFLKPKKIKQLNFANIDNLAFRLSNFMTSIILCS